MKPRESRNLRERRAKIRHYQKRGIHLLHDLPVLFGLVPNALPFRIFAESFPVGGGGFAARMRQDVNQRLVLERFIGRRPVRDVFHAVLLEQLYRVFAEAAKKVVELTLISVIDTEFVARG